MTSDTTMNSGELFIPGVRCKNQFFINTRNFHVYGLQKCATERCFSHKLSSGHNFPQGTWCPLLKPNNPSSRRPQVRVSWISSRNEVGNETCSPYIRANNHNLDPCFGPED